MTYIFFRKHEGHDLFYPVDLKDDAEAVRNAYGNPGTTRVETPDGRHVWPKPEHKQ